VQVSATMGKFIMSEEWKRIYACMMICAGYNEAQVMKGIHMCRNTMKSIKNELEQSFVYYENIKCLCGGSDKIPPYCDGVKGHLIGGQRHATPHLRAGSHRGVHQAPGDRSEALY